MPELAALATRLVRGSFYLPLPCCLPGQLPRNQFGRGNVASEKPTGNFASIDGWQGFIDQQPSMIDPVWNGPDLFWAIRELIGQK
ncbi:hypothetical protein COO20_01665 [Thalassospira marina]|uniref:Uncharacterized protein n=1 Tax=Thalassospira marina TaxID=2048283 RepID=A0A2N3KZF2_9PROT|nr:hypothetical protein COO20_01665 [Thalassospira marina]